MVQPKFALGAVLAKAAWQKAVVLAVVRLLRSNCKSDTSEKCPSFCELRVDVGMLVS